MFLQSRIQKYLGEMQMKTGTVWNERLIQIPKDTQLI